MMASFESTVRLTGDLTMYPFPFILCFAHSSVLCKDSSVLVAPIIPTIAPAHTDKHLGGHRHENFSWQPYCTPSGNIPPVGIKLWVSGILAIIGGFLMV